MFTTPGNRLRGNHPAVARHPQFWGLETEDTTRPRITTPRLRARRDIRLLIDGNERQIRKGDLLEMDDVVRTLVPDAIEPIAVES